MHKAELSFLEKPMWITNTPSEFAKNLPFYITEIGKFKAGINYFTERSNIDSMLIIYTVSGEAEFITKGTEQDISAGDLLFIDCNEYHKYKVKGDSWEFYWVHINSQAKNIVQSADTGNKVQMYSDVSEIFERLIIYVQKSDMLSAMNISYELHSLINKAVSDYYSYENKYENKLSKAVEYIHNNYKKQISVEDAAEKVHLSKYYFIRLFKTYMGTTPYKYILNTRINEAKILLRTTQMSVADISDEVGFLDESNFISNFKKQSGMKPFEYRRSFSEYKDGI